MPICPLAILRTTCIGTDSPFHTASESMKGVNGVSVTLDTHTDNLGSNIGDLVSVGLNNKGCSSAVPQSRNPSCEH